MLKVEANLVNSFLRLIKSLIDLLVEDVLLLYPAPDVSGLDFIIARNIWLIRVISPARVGQAAKVGGDVNSVSIESVISN